MGPSPYEKAGALSVEGPPLKHAAAQHTNSHRTGQHKTVPRWLRMSLRTALLVGLIAIPTLAVKEPGFANLTKYK